MANAGRAGLGGIHRQRLCAVGRRRRAAGDGLALTVRPARAVARIDGIEDIREDGTVVFRDQNVEYMREVVGYECKELKLEECEGRAEELGRGLKRLYEKYKVS